jgi:radical S-adenosyl methionine domain-containing protein 2
MTESITPRLKPDFIGEIFRFCKTELKLDFVSVVTNGLKVTEKWLDKYGGYLDIMALSCDSFDPETLLKIGRTENGKPTHVPNVLKVADMCRERGVIVKVNSVICQLSPEL